MRASRIIRVDLFPSKNTMLSNKSLDNQDLIQVESLKFVCFRFHFSSKQPAGVDLSSAERILKTFQSESFN